MARLTVIIIMSWWHEWQDDGDNNNELTVEDAAIVRCTNVWQTIQKHLWRTTLVVLWLVFISDRNVASSSVHFSYRNQPSPLISSFSSWNILSKHNSHRCQSDPSTLSLNRRHTCLVHLLYPSLTKKFGKCSSSRSLVDSLFYLNFLDFTCLSLLLDPSESFRFYRLL